MPWIFLCLLLANAVYFGWQFVQYGGGPRSHVATEDTTPSDKRLVLLSERPDIVKKAALAAAPAAASDAAPADASAMVADAGPQCFTVGPFTGGASPAHLEQRLDAKQLKTRVDVLKKDNVDYWVFVPALVNREQAEQKLADLRRKGIDSFIVNDEPFTNAISLGHFTKEELAQGLLGKVQGQGVQAEMRKLPRQGEERWIYVAPGAGKADPKTVIDAAIGNSDTLRRQPAPCDG